MARKTGADSADVISRLADSSEDAIRILIAFPLRIFVGAFDILDAQVHKVADTLRDIERVIGPESRAEAPEKHTARNKQASRTTSEASGSNAAPGHGGG